VRLRNVVLVLGAVALLFGLARRGRPSKYVEVHFEDGSTVRLTRGPEARDLLDDVNSVLDTVA
jgi:hypothetical protein